MLQSMRKHAKYFYVLFFVVIISFIFWGVGPKDKTTSENVAEIDKEKVTLKEFARAYKMVESAGRERYRELATDEERAQFERQLRTAVVEQLVDKHVLLMAARELGIATSNEELQKDILTNPAFQRGGTFRKEIYERTIAQQLELKPEGYEDIRRDELTVLKMVRLITSSVDVTDADIAGVKGDEAKAAMVKQMVLYNRQNAALQSFVAAVRAKMNVKINKDIIS